MAARLVAGGDAVDRERHDVRLLGLRPERGDDRMQRPHPGERARLFRRRAPAHRFRPGKALDHVGQDFADHLDRGAARLLDHRDIEVALLVGLHLGFADRFQPGGFEKAGDGVLRRADARALLLLAHIGLPRRHAVHGKRQPPRRHERLGALIDEPGIDQPVGDGFAQILRRPRLHARRDFFGEQFEQKIGHVGVASCSPPPCGEGWGWGSRGSHSESSQARHRYSPALVVPKSQHTIAFRFQKLRPHRVAIHLLCMLSAVNLNDDLQFMTGEIDDVLA